MDREIIKTKRLFNIIMIMLLAAGMLAMLGGCGINGAEAKVTEDLESMRYVELDPDVEAEMNSILTDKGKEYFEMFLAKAGEFEYEITDSKDDEVTVRITTYDFASEYLRSWSEFLEEADARAAEEKAGAEEKQADQDAEGENAVDIAIDAVGKAVNGEPEEEYDPCDDAELYERLFANLSKVKNKDYITEVTISCTQNEDGSWETDAKSNLELRNAILGGMLNEIAGLAEVSE